MTERTVYQHVMLDLETMGTGPNAAIVAIGAVALDLRADTLGPTFYATVDLGSSMQLGGVVDADTVYWWLRQGDEARAAIADGDVHISQALVDLRTWMNTYTDNTHLVWGNGADFDNVILASAYRRCGISQPWRTYANRCYRTLKNLHRDITVEREGTHHHALADACHQARHLQAMFQARYA